MLKLKAIAGVAFCLSAALSTGTALADKASARSRTGQLIIQLSDDGVRRIQSVGSGQAVPAVRLPDGREMKFVRRYGSNSVVVELPEEISLDAARDIAAQLAAQPGIVAAEPDKRFTAAGIPNDPEYLPDINDPLHDPGQWHLFEDTAGIRMQDAWDLSTGSSSIVVAVLDTGIISHRDLDFAGGRILPGYDFITDPVTANDGDGRDNDPTDPGDWADPADSCYTGNPDEDRSSWHGLSIAGVIAATSNNSTDIAGIDFNARLLPIRVLGKCGGSLSDVADAIRWAVGLSVSGVAQLNQNPANVINLSLTGDGACSPQEQAAIDAAVTAGAVVVVAGGNEGGDVASVSPANCNNVIVAGAIARDGSLASYANVGSNVDLVAPGGDSPVPNDPGNPLNNGIKTLSNFGATVADTSVTGDALAVIQGTSFSAAQVSAVASLMFAVNPALTPGLLENVLKGSTRAFPDASCTTSRCGTGVLDASAALAGAADPTSVVGISANTSGGGGCTLSAAPRAFDPLLWLLAAIAGCVPACRRFRC